MNTFRNTFTVRFGHSKRPELPFTSETREFGNAKAASRFRNRYLADAKIRGDESAFAVAEKSIDGEKAVEI